MREDKDFVKEIVPRSENFSEWYHSLVRKAELADYTAIRGCMVIRPYGFALWENMRDILDRKFKATGHVNAYFPLFVPESYLTKEAEHIEGFAPECAWVTHGGNEELEERLAIRPTSEAVICSIYSKWVQSYRDLPLLINQWANVVRWEKTTRLFLRTTEFLWQEGHTVHRTEADAQEETLRMLEVYREFLEEDLCVPVYPGEKTAKERFAGAQATYTVEALMGDGKALQAGTSHNLGQHFSKAFNIKFLDEDNSEKFAWQTSWGVSTRLVGGLIMVHGDDSGLVFPPRIAPIQAVIVPILQKKGAEEVLQAARELRDRLQKQFRVKLDDSDNKPGWKYNEWEMKGVPIRLELGPRDIKEQKCVLVRRDNREKQFVPLDKLEEVLQEQLDGLQKGLFLKAKEHRDSRTREVTDYGRFKEIMASERGFIFAPWDGTPESEQAIKEETKATIRCIPFEQPSLDGAKDLHSGQPAKHWVYFAQAY